MLNEERVILMSRMASYEKGEGRKNVRIGNYYRSDYIAVQVLKSVICGTLAYGIVFALYILYDFEVFMQDLYKIDLIVFARDILIRYIVFVVAYSLLTYVVCTWRYAKAKNSLKRYYYNLKKLNALYGGENRGRTAGGRK